MMFFRKIGALDSKLLRVVMFLFILFGVAASVVTYWVSGKATERALTEQMLHREQLVTRAGASAVENYVSSLGSSLVILGDHIEEEIAESGGDKIIKYSLSSFLDNYSGAPVISVLYVDELGDIKYLYQNGGFVKEKQVNVSDRQYFILAKEMKGNGYVVGIPVIPRSGMYTDRYIIPVASPIIIDGEFRGVVVGSSDISRVTETYLNNLRISERSNVYLLGDQGVVLSAHAPDPDGMNIFDFTDQGAFPQKEFLIDAVKKDLKNDNQKREGKLDYVRNDFKDESAPERYLTAYNIIRLEKVSGSPEEKHWWILAVETPAKDAFLFTGPFFGNQFLTFLAFIFTVLGIVFLGILIAKVQEKEGYTKGFLRGRGEKLE